MNIGTNLGPIVGYKPKAPLLAKNARNGAPGDLRAYFVCHARWPALQQRRIVRTISYPRLHSMPARSLLLQAKSPTLRLRSGQAFSQRTREMGHPNLILMRSSTLSPHSVEFSPPTKSNR
jgi:hypothetical protein